MGTCIEAWYTHTHNQTWQFTWQVLFLRILQAQFLILCFGYFKEIANTATHLILVENSKLTLIDVNNTLWRRLAIPGSRSSSSLAMSSELDCDMIVLYWFADPLLLPKKCKEEWQIDSDIFQPDEGKMSNHITSVLNILSHWRTKAHKLDPLRSLSRRCDSFLPSINQELRTHHNLSPR